MNNLSSLPRLEFSGCQYENVTVEGFRTDGTVIISTSKSDVSVITTVVARRLAAHLLKVCDELEGKQP